MITDEDDRPDNVDAAGNIGRNIYQRLVSTRKQLRNVQLWQPFEIEGRTFDAFGINMMVDGVEKALLINGLWLDVDVDTWQKNGNVSVVTATVTITNVDDPTEQITKRSVGEGVDNSDKGINKAITAAIKNAVRQILFLKIGIDNEATNVNADPSHGGSYSSSRQAPPPRAAASPGGGQGGAQGAPVAAHSAAPQGAPPPSRPEPGLYWFDFGSARPPALLAAPDVLAAVADWLSALNPGDASSIEMFIANNKIELDRFADEDGEAHDGKFLKPVEQLIIAAKQKAYAHAA